jgi:hypothetical protein
MKKFWNWLVDGFVEIANESGLWALRGFGFAFGAMVALTLFF